MSNILKSISDLAIKILPKSIMWYFWIGVAVSVAYQANKFPTNSYEFLFRFGYVLFCLLMGEIQEMKNNNKELVKKISNKFSLFFLKEDESLTKKIIVNETGEKIEYWVKFTPGNKFQSFDEFISNEFKILVSEVKTSKKSEKLKDNLN